MKTPEAGPGSSGGDMADLAIRLCLRTFRVAAVAEGGLLPAILILGLIHWISGRAPQAVAIVGATHGAAFTLYLLVTPLVARVLHWSPRMVSVAVSVAFVPFATWAFERRVRPELTRSIAAHRGGSHA